MRRLCLLLTLALAACVPSERPDYWPRRTAETPPTLRERWQPQEVVVNARRVAAQSYRVRPGDSVSVIAQRTGSSISSISQANGLSPPYRIFPNQILAIPGGRYHRVNRGETGIAIALAYRIDWDRIVAANGLRPPYLLQVGQRLLLPDDAPPQRRVADTAPPPSPPVTAPEKPADKAAQPTRMAAFDIDIDDIISGGEPAQPAGSPPPVRRAAPAPFDGRFAWPVEGRLVSSFGAKAGGLYNDGINIAAPKGTAVHAAASGTVIYAGNGIEGWGNLVLVKHDDEWVTAYAHNDAFYVERGDRVGRGDTIAEVGETGSVDAPQLHFELRRGRKPVDPAAHLSGTASAS